MDSVVRSSSPLDLHLSPPTTMTTSTNTVVLITGANQGKSLIISSEPTRQESAEPSSKPSSAALTTPYSAANPTDPAAAIQSRTDINTDAGIGFNHIDIVIASAGGTGSNGMVVQELAN
ncbi:hypothetical protein BJX76DRAFT_358999 [Aspergillus varians]